MNYRFIKLLLILMISFWVKFCFAQTIDSTLQAKGDSLVKKGQGFYFSNKIDSAIIYCKSGAKKLKEAQAWGQYIGALNDISYIYYSDKEYIKFNKAALHAYNESTTYLAPNSLYRITAFNNLQTHYYSLGDYAKAIDISRKVLHLSVENNSTKSNIIRAYINLGNAYRFSGDYANAINYLKKGLELYQDSIPKNPILANTYKGISRTFRANNQIDSTIHYLKEGAQLLKAIPSDSPLLKLKGDIFLDLAELWNEKEAIPKAKDYLAQASKTVANDFYKVKYEEIHGKILYSQQKYLLAIKAFEKAQAIAQKSKKRNTPPYQARRLIELAKAFEAADNTEDALTTYQNALTILSPNFNSNQYQDNPKIDQLLDKPDALNILNNKARLLYNNFSSNENKDQLYAAYQTYLSATNLIRNFRQGILTSESKKTLSAQNIEIYEGAIQTALDLYKQTNEEQYKETAFYLAESNKALLLLENLNEQSAKISAGIPDSLLEKEKDLKLNLAYLQKVTLENKLIDQTNKNTATEIFNLQQQLDLFTTNLEKSYPRYFDLKYRNEPSQLSSIQQSLTQTDRAFLEYFVGEDAIYLFILTEEQLMVKTIKNNDSIRSKVEALRAITTTPPSMDFGKVQFQSFVNLANGLYQQLIQPALEALPSEIKNLTIIPDDYLNFLPFDVLLSSNLISEMGLFSANSLAYLFEDFNLSYDYSITLHLKNQQRASRDFKYNFVGFAPSFNDAQTLSSRSCIEDNLYTLRCSEKEVGAISDLTHGTKYFGQEVTRETFETGIQDYRIIHLATHACIDEENSNFNKIFLTDDYLSDLDLYNLQLNSELAVLSACNTGSGKLIKGEGVMSLARGFINAGCSSTLISMWSVDDCATSDIMLYFYQGLEQDLPKEQALQYAKLKYLDQVDKSKMHPYYWAAFVPFGDMAPLELHGNSNTVYYILALLGFLLIFIFARKLS